MIVDKSPRKRFARPTVAMLIGFVLISAGGRAREADISGFAPIDPPMKAGVTVASLRPTLRWDPIPRDASGTYPNSAFTTTPGQVENVTYQVRIWKAEDKIAGDVVYDKVGIREPMHTVEIDLKPATEYFWSVRSRFDLNGHPRISEWSLAAEGARGFERDTARFWGTLPPDVYFRFRTP